ncbi:MAG: hydrogenase maturation protease [Spirochaetes bacterium]|nr:hydrogenase maturation protease [Spirochaetota bacterium]
MSDEKILILGYGNEMRGDDGVGPLVAQLLEKTLEGMPVGVRQAQMLLPEFIVDFSQVEKLVLVDATVNVAPGEWTRKPIVAVASADGSPLPSVGHFLSPESVLGSVRALFDREPETWLYTIGVAEMAIGFQLSPRSRAAAELVAREIELQVRGWLAAR